MISNFASVIPVDRADFFPFSAAARWMILTFSWGFFAMKFRMISTLSSVL